MKILLKPEKGRTREKRVSRVTYPPSTTHRIKSSHLNFFLINGAILVRIESAEAEDLTLLYTQVLDT